jgi:hypothetical protein
MSTSSRLLHIYIHNFVGDSCFRNVKYIYMTLSVVLALETMISKAASFISVAFSILIFD